MHLNEGDVGEVIYLFNLIARAVQKRDINYLSWNVAGFLNKSIIENIGMASETDIIKILEIALFDPVNSRMLFNETLRLISKEMDENLFTEKFYISFTEVLNKLQEKIFFYNINEKTILLNRIDEFLNNPKVTLRPNSLNQLFKNLSHLVKPFPSFLEASLISQLNELSHIQGTWKSEALATANEARIPIGSLEKVKDKKIQQSLG